MNSTVSLEHSNEIPSLLVPTALGNLLLPTVTVAEMIPFMAPHVGADMAGRELPKWYMGNLHWRGLKVPMFSYEVINDQPLAAINEASQIVILNSTGDHQTLPFTCFPATGIPHLTRVMADEISGVHTAELTPYQSMAVSIAGSQAVIPDVARCEQVLADLLGH